jgi:hypothetical protein
MVKLSACVPLAVAGSLLAAAAPSAAADHGPGMRLHANICEDAGITGFLIPFVAPKIARHCKKAEEHRRHHRHRHHHHRNPTILDLL